MRKNWIYENRIVLIIPKLSDSDLQRHQPQVTTPVLPSDSGRELHPSSELYRGTGIAGLPGLVTHSANSLVRWSRTILKIPHNMAQERTLTHQVLDGIAQLRSNLPSDSATSYQIIDHLQHGTHKKSVLISSIFSKFLKYLYCLVFWSKFDLPWRTS